jgi:hypothetical protein
MTTKICPDCENKYDTCSRCGGTGEVEETRAEKHARCLELIGHPKNRAYFEKVLTLLQEGGRYGWIDMQEVFTKEEIRKALESHE